jgi:heat-inducible transcriptional repressor
MTPNELVLDDRKSAILRAIVSHYVRTGEPVASKTLVDRYRLGVSSATVRNEMSALEEAGFIYQPHTSAGRIPTDLGYRHFVDAFGSNLKLPAQETMKIQAFFGEPRWELEDALRQTASLLSSLTDHAAVVFAPALEKSTVRHVELIGLAGARAMVIVVTDTGQLDNHAIVLPEGITQEDLDDASELLARLLVGAGLDATAGIVNDAIPEAPADLRDLLGTVALVLAEGVARRIDEKVFLEGASNIVDEHKFHDLETVRQIIAALEHRRLLLEVLADGLAVGGVSVRIGSENQAIEMQACSVIAAPYGSELNLLGSLGVVGPTRMDYRRTIAAVYEVSANLGRMLTELGI